MFTVVNYAYRLVKVHNFEKKSSSRKIEGLKAKLEIWKSRS